MMMLNDVLLADCVTLQVLTLGSTGEEVQLELTLRVVADVGLVVCLLSPPT